MRHFPTIIHLYSYIVLYFLTFEVYSSFNYQLFCHNFNSHFHYMKYELLLQEQSEDRDIQRAKSDYKRSAAQVNT